jgi:hypothetical protein
VSARTHSWCLVAALGLAAGGCTFSPGVGALLFSDAGEDLQPTADAAAVDRWTPPEPKADAAADVGDEAPAPLPDAGTDTFCQPVDCLQPGGSYCGTIPNGCGGLETCPDCMVAGETCGGSGTPHVCGAASDAGCQPVKCMGPGYRYCGVIGDGCGKSQDCGTCPGGQTCGGAGTDNVCG